MASFLFSADLRWGKVAKDTAVEKQQKYAVMAQNRPLRSFRKGRGASAKQPGVILQGWGAIAKGAVKTQRWGRNATASVRGGVKTQKP